MRATHIEAASQRMEQTGLSYDAPRLYPNRADLGFRWTKQGPYWIAFTDGPIIAGIFYGAADIPGRV
jgi:hypothetical protein